MDDAILKLMVGHFSEVDNCTVEDTTVVFDHEVTTASNKHRGVLCCQTLPSTSMMNI